MLPDPYRNGWQLPQIISSFLDARGTARPGPGAGNRAAPGQDAAADGDAARLSMQCLQQPDCPRRFPSIATLKRVALFKNFGRQNMGRLPGADPTQPLRHKSF